MSNHLLQRTPLPVQIAALLREQLRSQFATGAKLPSEITLARQFDVSVLTMREALQRLAQEGWIQRRRGSGTYVLERPATAAWVGLLADSSFSEPQASYFYRRVLGQYQQQLHAAGYPVRFYFASRPTPTAQVSCIELERDLTAHQLAGLVVTGFDPLPEWVAELRRQRRPVVGCFPDSAFAVCNDPADIVRQAVPYLAAQGCRRLALLTYSDALAEAALNVADSTVSVFRDQLAQHGLPFDPHWCRSDLHPLWTGTGWEQLREIWSASATKPDGLVITDDVLFAEAVRALIELRVRVPDQLRIVTHFTKGAPILCPFPVARVEVDPDEFAHATATALARLLRGEALSAPTAILATRFVTPAIAPAVFQSTVRT